MSDNKRRIRSYVLRAARMSEAQKKAYDELFPKWGIPFRQGFLDWNAAFGRDGKRIVEIGFGMGDATRRMAVVKPEWNILGVEVHRPGVGKLLWWMEQESLENIRVIEHDAVEVLQNVLEPGSVDGFHIWFPDPWPKKRHHKRRLIQPELVEHLVRVLKPGGYIHAATDWEHYACHILAVLNGHPNLENRFEQWAPKPDYRPDTKFENRGLTAGRQIRDIIFEKGNV